LLLLLFFAVQNIHESDLLRLGTFMWVPYVAASVSLALMETRSPIRVVGRSSSPEEVATWDDLGPSHREQAAPLYES
jgi:hypothetical protein